MAVSSISKNKRVDYMREIFARLSLANPNPTTELAFTNPYTLLVAVVLSAQATDIGVNKATKALFAKVDTPEKMVALGEEGLKGYIKTIGLYNAKARNIIALSQVLIKQHHSQVPEDIVALQALPGVGIKTAKVVMNCAFGAATLAVDTHVFRLGHRLALSKAKTPEKMSEELEQQIPAPFNHDAHHWLILHGRYVCKARKPLCDACVLADLCPSADLSHKN